MEKQKMLRGGVIGTLMSNYGLEKFFKRLKIKFLRANVGDRYVKEKMKIKPYILQLKCLSTLVLGLLAFR